MTLIIFIFSLHKIWKIQRPLKAVKLNTAYTTMHMLCVFLLLLQWGIDLFFYDLINSYDNGSKNPCNQPGSYYKYMTYNTNSDSVPIEFIVDLFLLYLILKLARDDSVKGPYSQLVLIKGIQKIEEELMDQSEDQIRRKKERELNIAVVQYATQLLLTEDRNSSLDSDARTSFKSQSQNSLNASVGVAFYSIHPSKNLLAQTIDKRKKVKSQKKIDHLY